MFVARLVAVTETPGSTPPLASATRPTISPVPCAADEAAKPKSKMTTPVTIRTRAIEPPVGETRLSGARAAEHSRRRRADLLQIVRDTETGRPRTPMKRAGDLREVRFDETLVDRRQCRTAGRGRRADQLALDHVEQSL